MSVRVIALVDDERDPLVVLAADYLKRAGRKYSATLMVLRPERRKRTDDDHQVREREGKSLHKASEGACRIVLDAGGKQFTSEAFSQRLEKLLAGGRDVCFLVGGASGHADSVKSSADETWSLAPLTLPHKLAIVVVAEQIYRSHEIVRGGPYHK